MSATCGFSKTKGIFMRHYRHDIIALAAGSRGSWIGRITRTNKPGVGQVMADTQAECFRLCHEIASILEQKIDNA